MRPAAVDSTVQARHGTLLQMSTLPPPPVPNGGTPWALFLDLDGTLIELAETPEAVFVPAALPAQLQHLGTALGGALAVVSGRSIATIDRLLATAGPLPAAGLHGIERRDAAGRVHRVAVSQRALDEARRALDRFVVAHPLCLLEDKGASLALHYRRDPDSAAAAHAAMDDALAQAGDDTLQVQAGHRVLELKSRLADKGAAIHAFLDEAPWEGRTPVFVGDDLTDEHGFAVVRERGGIAIRVGTPPDGSAATHALPGPRAVHEWLSAVQHQLTR